MEFELGTLTVLSIFRNIGDDPSTRVVLIRCDWSRPDQGADNVRARDADFQSDRALLCWQAPDNALFASFRATSFLC